MVMQPSWLTRFSLKTRLYCLIAFLGLLPVVSLLIALLTMRTAQEDYAVLDRAVRGTIYLERINGLVYAIVMDSRGIYMSPDWKTAEPYGKGMQTGLARLREVAQAWRINASAAHRSNVDELARRDGLGKIWLVGYSMGGNLVLKAAGELGRTEPALAGVAAVCPNIDPAICARALEEPHNWIYHRHFLARLKSRLRREAALRPGRWDLSTLDQITTISEFDDHYTARDGGYRDGADYYDRAGARHVLHAIAVPTFIITAQDDPIIPYSMFTKLNIKDHPHIRVVAPRYGGHCGFFQWSRNGEDPYWAENRIVDFLLRHL